MHWARDLAAHADDIDDRTASPRNHASENRVDGVNIGEEFRVHRIVPCRGVEIGRRIAERGTGGVHEDVDWPRAGLGRGSHALGVFGPDQVGGDHLRRRSAPWPAGASRFEVGQAA